MELAAGGFWLALRLVGAGWWWGLAADRSARGQGPGSFWWCAGRAVVAGLLVNLLPILGLAALGIWTPRLDWAAWACGVAAGVFWAWRRNVDLRRAAPRGLAALLLVWGLGSLPLLQPPRSEWLAGGWDPGIYQNNAVAIARAGGWHARTNSIYAAMTPAERTRFSAAENGYREVFPSVPLRLADGALPLYSFRLTPVCGAWFLRMGGLGLLVRLPAVLAAWTVPPLLALLGLVGFCGWRRWVALGAWMLSPLWWYQQAIPTAEMPYLLLLLGTILFYVPAALDRAPLPLGAAGALFAGIANHLNLAALAGGMLVIVAGVEGQLRRPGRWARVMACFAAVALGIAWNLGSAGVVVARLEQKDLALSAILAIGGGAAVLAAALLWRPWPQKIRTWGRRWIPICGAVVGAGLAIFALGAGTAPGHAFLMKAADGMPLAGSALKRMLRVMLFTGALPVAWAGVGVVGLARRKDSERAVLQVLVMILGVVCLALFLAPGIAPLYPWALRRYVAFLVPFLALSQAYAVVAWCEGLRFRGRGWQGIALLLLVPAAIQSARLSRAAFRVGDYAGFGQLVRSLEQRIGPGDVVVADDRRWGTPLLLAAGRDVVNGEFLWASEDPASQRNYVETLQRLRAATGRRVLWLTSTDKQLGIYPVGLGEAGPPLAEIPYAYRTVIHSRRGDGFADEPHARTLRLFEWDGRFRMPGSPAGESAAQADPGT